MNNSNIKQSLNKLKQLDVALLIFATESAINPDMDSADSSLASQYGRVCAISFCARRFYSMEELGSPIRITSSSLKAAKAEELRPTMNIRSLVNPHRMGSRKCQDNEKASIRAQFLKQGPESRAVLLSRRSFQS